MSNGYLTSEAEFQVAIDNMLEAVFVIDNDTDNTIVYQNKQATKILGAPAGLSAKDLNTFVKRRSADGTLLVHPETTPVGRALQGETISNEEIHVTVSGEKYVFLYNVIPICGSNRSVDKVVANLKDITEEWITKQRLKASNEDLLRFAGVISHDLQEPLRTVACFTEMLGKNHENTQYLYEQIEAAVSHIELLLTDLIHFADASNDLVTETVDVGEVVNTTLQVLQKAISDRNIKVHVDPLPTIKSHRLLLIQIFQNLISNATKYSPMNTKIHISSSRDKQLWLFSVQDQGIGIGSQDRKKIFEFLKRMYEDSAVFHGTGVGLAICKRAIELCGGHIWVESEGEGKGSTFFFTLPAADGDHFNAAA